MHANKLMLEGIQCLYIPSRLIKCFFMCLRVPRKPQMLFLCHSTRVEAPADAEDFCFTLLKFDSLSIRLARAGESLRIQEAYPSHHFCSTIYHSRPFRSFAHAQT